MPASVSARRRARSLSAAVIAALALGLAACGDDDEDSGDDGTAEPAAEAVTLTADEYTFDLSATPTAETTEVTFDNQGKELHVMVFARLNEGFTVDEAVKLEGEKGSAVTVAQTEAPPGKSKTVEIQGPLDPGNYVMLCPIQGPEGAHYELGQLQEFEIG